MIYIIIHCKNALLNIKSNGTLIINFKNKRGGKLNTLNTLLNTFFFVGGERIFYVDCGATSTDLGSSLFSFHNPTHIEW